MTMSMSTITTTARSVTAMSIITTMMKIAPVAAMIMITIITITITPTRCLSAAARKRRFALTPPCWLKSWVP